MKQEDIKENAIKVIKYWRDNCIDNIVVTDIIMELRIINLIDFYQIIEEDDEVRELFEEVDEGVNKFLEDRQKKIVFSNEKVNGKVLSMMIEANNKRKYIKNYKDSKSEIEEKSKDEIINDLSNLMKEINSRDTLKR